MNATTIGVDLSKSVFQLSLSNSAGRVIERKRLSRAQYERFLVQQPPAEIVMEACATCAPLGTYRAQRTVINPVCCTPSTYDPTSAATKPMPPMPMPCCGHGAIPT